MTDRTSTSGLHLILGGCLIATLVGCEGDLHTDSDLGFRDRGRVEETQERGAASTDACVADLTEQVASGELPGFVMTDEGVAQMPPLSVSCEELLVPPDNPPGNTVSHGQAICDWKVADGPGQLEFVVWEGAGGEPLCGCKCASCVSDGELAFEYDAIGEGSAVNPYEIYNAEQVTDLASDPDGWGGHFVQCNDVDLAPHYASEGDEFVIGIEDTPFEGEWDGREHTLAGFRLTAPLDNSASGLFAVASQAVIHDLTFAAAVVALADDTDPAMASHATGALIGRGEGVTVERVRLGGGIFVSGHRLVGGLAGLLSDSIVNGVEAEATVMGTRTIGGAFGLLQDTTVSNTTAWADVSYVPPAVPSSQNAGSFGGLFGFAYGDTVISHSESHGVVFAVPEGEGLQGVGGFGGHLYQGATITHCVSTASATGGGLVGGLLGSLTDADVEWSYATGDATGMWPKTGTAAGFIGNVGQAMNSASIHVRNSYSTGDAVAPTSAAGFVFTGVNSIDNPGGEPVIENCYAAGDAVALDTGEPWEPNDAAAFMISRSGSLPLTDSSFALGLATSASGPPSTFHFANHPANSSNAYNVDAGTPVNATATGAQPASEAAGDFEDPNVAPLSMAWPTGPGQWDFTTTAPSIPSAGN